MLGLLPLVSLFPLFLLLHLAHSTTYILSFNSYNTPTHHTKLITNLLHLTPPTQYNLLPRHVPLTDFLLLETPHRPLLTLLKHPHIKHITPNRKTRHPLAHLPLTHIPQHPPHPPRAAHTHTRHTRHTRTPIPVAIFDTGISPHIQVASAHDWTPDNTTTDHVGHGTFVASLLTSTNPLCPGLSPGAELHIFRVFTTAQISYTSWFLDAFNYALHIGISVLNLSIGGPDFADAPFVDKVNELAAHGVIIISAIGNDGPLWGSLNNPADMMDVIGVGGFDERGIVAAFSSRGMSTHGLPDGYGRVKPDLLARATSLLAQGVDGRCTRLSGTSVASPVIAAAVVRLMESVPAESAVVNPASVKRALVQGCRQIPASVYEQGAGVMHLPDSVRVMQQIVKEDLVDGVRAIAFPAYYDLREEGCPYMWPHCAQSLYRGQQPTVLNVTLLNPAGVEGRVGEVLWMAGRNAHLLKVVVSKPQRFWPWAGGMGIHLTAVGEPKELTHAEGVLKVTVESVHEGTQSVVEIPIMAHVIPPPPREKRLLWDVFHSIRYPPGYVPRDALNEKKDMLDWLGDHPHTNFHRLFRQLRRAGFYVDVLDRSLECLGVEEAKHYGGILLFDSEDFFSEAETAILQDLVTNHGTALIVAAEWYNLDIMREIRFEDDNTRSWWTPVVAGGNVPALNNLLRGFGVAFGDAVLSGDVSLGSSTFRFESGVPLVMFPGGGQILYSDKLSPDAGRKVIEADAQGDEYQKTAVLGISKIGRGAVVAYGDTHCIDTVYKGARCYGFFTDVIRHAIMKCSGEKVCEMMHPDFRILPNGLTPTTNPLRRLAKPLSEDLFSVFRPHSRVLNKTITTCTRHEQHEPPQARFTRTVRLPAQRPVHANVARQSYLGDLSGLDGDSSAENAILDGVPFLRPLLSRSSVFRVRGIVAILVGLFLILVSFSIDRFPYSKAKKKRILAKQIPRSRPGLPYSGINTRVFRGADFTSYPLSRYLSVTSSED